MAVELVGLAGCRHDSMTAARASVNARLISRIGLLRDRRVERRQRGRLARLEHRLRGVETLGGIGRHQGQAAERGCRSRGAAGC